MLDVSPVDLASSDLQDAGYVAEVLFGAAFPKVLHLLQDYVFGRGEEGIDVRVDGANASSAAEARLFEGGRTGNHNVSFVARLGVNDIELSVVLDRLSNGDIAEVEVLGGERLEKLLEVFNAEVGDDVHVIGQTTRRRYNGRRVGPGRQLRGAVSLSAPPAILSATALRTRASSQSG